MYTFRTDIYIDTYVYINMHICIYIHTYMLISMYLSCLYPCICHSRPPTLSFVPNSTVHSSKLGMELDMYVYPYISIYTCTRIHTYIHLPWNMKLLFLSYFPTLNAKFFSSFHTILIWIHNVTFDTLSCPILSYPHTYIIYVGLSVCLTDNHTKTNAVQNTRKETHTKKRRDMTVDILWEKHTHTERETQSKAYGERGSRTKTKRQGKRPAYCMCIRVPT